MRMSDWSADVCSSDLDLCDALEAGGPYGAGWPAPRVAAGPVRIVKADVVGNGHLRLIVAGDDGRRIKAIAFRMAESALGQAMPAAPPHRKLWIRSEEHTSELQSLKRNSYDVFCLKKQKNHKQN